MIINLNEFGGGGGQVSPEEIEEIVNENHYTKEESDAIVNDVKAVADEAKTIAEAKQDILVSGTNIKTINGEDILGEGDIEIKVDAYTKEESDARYVQKEPVVPNNEIWYWTTDGNTAQTTNKTGITSLNTMGLVSNEVVGDKCVMTFSKDVTEIGQYAFYSCKSLSSIVIPNSVTSIGYSAFYYCSYLSSITIPNSITSIGNGAFRDCSSLTSIIIPDSVTSLGNSVFNSCYAITSVTIGNSVTSIGSSAFNDCVSLTSVTIGNSVTSIGYSAFFNCRSLTGVTILGSVTSIDSSAFIGVPTGGTLYCVEDWFNNLSDTNKTNLRSVKNWTKVWIPKSINWRVDVLETDVTQIKEDIKDIELVKSPNVVLFGTPSIQNGQMDSFSSVDYAQFPFLVDLNSYNQWEINFEITVSYDGISGQHNIFDSNYGLAFAIRDGHFVIAYSNDGTTWTKELTGTNTLSQLITTYKVKIYHSYFEGMTEFYVKYSTDGGTTWVNDIMGDGTDVKPHPTQIIIGKALNNSNVFHGIINLNGCDLITNYNVKWQGMDDVGLSTRLATDMSNIDAAGVQKIKDIIGGFTLSVLTQTEYDALEVKDSNTLYFIK